MSVAQDVQAQQIPQQVSSLSFTQGFLLGQLSVVIFIGAFIKFFIFGEAPVSSDSSNNRYLSTLSPTHKRTVSFTHRPSSPRKTTAITDADHRDGSSVSASSSHIIRPPPTLTPATILSKTYYNVHAHQPESLDWFNVLIAQSISQLRTDAHADNAILTSLTTLLNGPQKPDFLEHIAVTEISLGEDFPIFSNCRVQPVYEDEESGGGAGGGGRLQARMDVDLSDFITLGIETTMVLNYPRPRTAVLPVALSVSVVRFSGTLCVSFMPASTPAAAATAAAAASSSPFDTNIDPTATRSGRTARGAADAHQQQQHKHTPTTLAFSFLPNYTLSLSTRSLLGSRSRLQDVPKIAQLVESRLRTWFEERCVAPRRQQIVVPSLWPRMKNVVDEGEGAKDDASASVAASGISQASATGGAKMEGLGLGTSGSLGLRPGGGAAVADSAGTSGLRGMLAQPDGNVRSRGGEWHRDAREEAARELALEREEAERNGENGRARDAELGRGQWDGLRWRGGSGGEMGGTRRGGAAGGGEFDLPGSMPGSMPGMMVN